MSGIYIPGMEMPKGCDDCYFCGEMGICSVLMATHINGGVVDGYRYSEFERPPFCPLVPVPEHGRLIDADALDDILADQSEDAYNRTHAPRSWEKALSVMRDYLDGAPTIIPASGGKENE